MKQKVGRIVWGFGLVFLAIFILRLAYDFAFHRGGPVAVLQVTSEYVQSGEQQEVRKVNIASYKMGKQVDAGAMVRPGQEQKYEKIAYLQNRSTAFGEDESRLRSLVEREKGIIQSESQTGLPGRRFLDLTIGIPPERFVPVVDQIKGIGRLRSIRIAQTDKTTEYRNLLAKQASLEKAKQGLLTLKSRSGSIADLIELESKILEIEESLQGLSVQLGVYNQENEFCTVEASLVEVGGERGAFLSILRRIKSALWWTAGVYACGLGMLIFVLLASLLLLLVVEKARRATAASK